MKKKFLKGSLLPVLAGAAVIGSGFSLWFFADSETTQDFVPEKHITQVVALGDITNSDNFTIVFDQTAAGRKALGLESSTAEANGIYINWLGKTNKAAKYASVNDNGQDEIDHETGANAKIYFVFSASITVTNTGDTKLEEYFDIAYNGAKSSTREAGSNTYKIVLNDNVDTFDWEQVTFSYATGKEPANYEQYNAFKKAVTNANIKVTYKVEVLSK